MDNTSTTTQSPVIQIKRLSSGGWDDPRLGTATEAGLQHSVPGTGTYQGGSSGSCTCCEGCNGDCVI